MRLRNLSAARGEPTSNRLDSGGRQLVSNLAPAVQLLRSDQVFPGNQAFSAMASFRNIYTSLMFVIAGCNEQGTGAPSQLFESREPDPAEPIARATHSNSPREESLGTVR